jgi:hypothetical protein
MLLELPDIGAFVFDKPTLLEAAQNELHGFYTTNTDPMHRARSAAVAAVLNAAVAELTKFLDTRISDLYRSHELINEERAKLDTDDRRAAFDDAFAVWLWEHCQEVRRLLADEDRWEEIAGADVGFHELGRISEIAQAIALELKPHYAPPDKDVGKFLSRYGIVDADLKKLAAAAKKIPIPAAPIVETKVVLARPPETVSAAPIETMTTTPPTKDELADAIDWWAQGSGPEIKSAAAHLEISGGTLNNYIGRKTKPKLNSLQAKYLADDCRDCIDKLQRALAIFERVRANGGGNGDGDS